MSRSRRKTPITGITAAESEKQDKRRCNRGVRRINKHRLKQGDVEDINPREYMNPYSMAKDGRRYRDPDEFPELMRK